MIRAFAVRLGLLLIAGLPALVRAQALADKVPADTTLYIGWSGADASVPGFKGSNFQAVLDSSNMRALVDDFLPRVLDQIARKQPEAAQGVAILRSFVGPLARHPFALAFVGVDIDPQKGPQPKLLLLSQAGNEAAALKAQVDQLLKQAGPTPLPVNVIERGDLLALIIGYDKPESAIPAAGAPSLATAPTFTKALGQVGKDGALTFYIDIDKTLNLVDMGMGMAPAEIKANWDKTRDTLGLKGLHRAIFTAGFEGKEWGVQGYVDAPAPRSEFLSALLEAKPLSKDIYDAIPENASSAAGVHFDLNALVDNLRNIAGMLDPNSQAQFDQALQQANQMVGLDIRKDFLGNLGDEWAFYADPSVAGNGIVSATVVNHLKDAAKFEAALTKLEDSAMQAITAELKKQPDAPTIALHRVDWGGISIHYIGLPLVAPAWAVHNGNLYISLYPETTVAAARHTPGKDKSISDNPAFAALMKKLGNHPASSFQFDDIPRLAPETYSSWLVISHLTGIGEFFGVPAPLQIIPPLRSLMPLLSASGEVSWTDDAGAHFHGITSFPGADIFASDPTSISAAEAPLLISIMLPALNKVRQEALKAKSASNLKNIAAGAITYANAHNGKYPKDMGELVVDTGMMPQIVIDPRSDSASPPPNLDQAQIKQWVNQHTDYVWNGAGKDSTTGADDPLAWEDPNKVPGTGINILFGDYHVAFYPSQQAMEIIKKGKNPGL